MTLSAAMSSKTLLKDKRVVRFEDYVDPDKHNKLQIYQPPEKDGHKKHDSQEEPTVPGEDMPGPQADTSNPAESSTTVLYLKGETVSELFESVFKLAYYASNEEGILAEQCKEKMIGRRVYTYLSRQGDMPPNPEMVDYIHAPQSKKYTIKKHILARLYEYIAPNARENLQYDFYSTIAATPGYYARFIMHIVKMTAHRYNMLGDNTVVGDCTAGIGGVTAWLATMCPKVIAVEYDERRVKMLRSNLNVVMPIMYSDPQKVQCVHGDSASDLAELKECNILFYAPTWDWGTYFYHSHSCPPIQFGYGENKRDIGDVIHQKLLDAQSEDKELLIFLHVSMDYPVKKLWNRLNRGGLQVEMSLFDYNMYLKQMNERKDLIVKHKNIKQEVLEIEVEHDDMPEVYPMFGKKRNNRKSQKKKYHDDMLISLKGSKLDKKLKIWESIDWDKVDPNSELYALYANAKKQGFILNNRLVDGMVSGIEKSESWRAVKKLYYSKRDQEEDREFMRGHGYSFDEEEGYVFGDGEYGKQSITNATRQKMDYAGEVLPEGWEMVKGRKGR